MSETQELATVTSSTPTLSATDIKKQVNLIQEVMKKVMEGPSDKNKTGVHYGVIPGCKLPSLYKAGAEKLAMTFRLGAEYKELDGIVERDDFIMYKIDCILFYIPTGNVVGHGRGTCNSKEKKYRTRMVYANKATDEEKSIGRKETRKSNTGDYDVYIVPQDPWDIQNTLYKMACKRAIVAAIINATAASDIFSQDLEDLPDGTIIEAEATPAAGKPAVNMPQEKYTDILTLASGKLGEKFNVAAYIQTVKHEQKPKKSNKAEMVDITKYAIMDLPKDATVQTTITVFGKPIDIGQGQSIKFHEVEVGDYNGSRQYTAKEAVNG